MSKTKEYEWVTVAEAAKLCGLSKTTIYVMIKAGKFPRPVKLGMRRVAFQKEIVLNWIKKRINESR